MANPAGPLTHHWLDSTHVSFGVVTLGVHNQRWKAEASLFNGREADTSRLDVDLGSLESFAARVSFLASDRLAVQASAGRLRRANSEFPFPDQDPTTRVTASAVYHVPLGPTGIWATTAAVGANHAREMLSEGILEATTVAALVESSATWSNRHTMFGRAEVGGMPAHHLHAHEYFGSVFTVGKLQFGYVRHLRAIRGVQPGVGATVSASLLPSKLAPDYSGQVAPGFGVFFSLHAARHAM